MKYTFIALLCMFALTTKAQQTAFEKKKLELSKKLLIDLGVSQSQLNNTNDVGELESFFLATTIMKSISTPEGMIAFERFNNNLKKFEYLKTEIDFKKEREKKQKEEEEAKLKKDNEEKEKIRIEEEVRIKEELEIKFKNSDRYKVNQKLKDKLNSWLTKGEFEKTEDYNIRINTQFDSIFNNYCLNEVFRKVNRFSRNKEQTDIENGEIYVELTSEIIEYVADSEKFKIRFKINDYEWENNIEYPISKAENFKTNFNQFKKYVNQYDWGYYDNNFVPLSVKMIVSTNPQNEEVLSFDSKLDKIEELVFNSNDIITNSNLNKEYEYNYTRKSKEKIEKYETKLMQKKIQNKYLEKVGECDRYNRNFDRTLPSDIEYHSTQAELYGEFLQCIIGACERILQEKEDTFIRKKLDLNKAKLKEAVSLQNKPKKDAELVSNHSKVLNKEYYKNRNKVFFETYNTVYNHWVDKNYYKMSYASERLTYFSKDDDFLDILFVIQNKLMNFEDKDYKELIEKIKNIEISEKIKVIYKEL